MAPVTVTTQGIDRQIIDDPQLVDLVKRLSTYDKTTRTKTAKEDELLCADPEEEDRTDSIATPQAECVNVEGLVGELERWSSHWKFQELADLYEWIRPLNAIDAAIRLFLKEYPALLLIRTNNNSKSEPNLSSGSANHGGSMDQTMEETMQCQQAESEADVKSVPATVIHALSTMLQFLSILLRYATNKWVFNSVSELSQLLAAANDDIAALALEVLANLATPPLSHRLPSQEVMAHSTVLHSASSSSQDVHSRLMTLARGWGTKGCGLGLLQCVTTDDSATGQGTLPQFAGEMVFEFLPPKETKSQRVFLSTDDVFEEVVVDENLEGVGQEHYDSKSDLSSSPCARQNEKRRKMSGGNRVGIISGSTRRQIKSTASLFFQCLEQIGGRSRISKENLFTLLAQIRLAVSFHSQALRIAAVERRMSALIATLYSNPQPAVLVGYFQAQPELCNEIGDLVRPIVSAAAVSATGFSQKKKRYHVAKSDGMAGSGIVGVHGTHGEEQRNAAIASIVEPATTVHIPYKTRYLALETLTAIVTRKDDSSTSGLSQVARLTNVLGELGIGKGQFLGLLPTLVRYSLASLNLYLSAKKSQDETDVEMNGIDTEGKDIDAPLDIEELGLDLGLTFLEATKPFENEYNQEVKALEFVEAVLSLASSIISVTTGTASLTDCGLIPAIVSTISLISSVCSSHDQLPIETNDSVTKNYFLGLLKYVLSQSIQVLEGAIITHNPALAAFHDLNGVDLLVTLLHSEFCDTFVENSPVEGKSADVQIKLNGSTRVALFSILNCLTIVFHHQETDPRSNNAPMSPADVLRRPDVTMVVKSIISNIRAYGGVLGALATTLLSDVMNSDPRVVHYVYDSGLADVIFQLLKGSEYHSESNDMLDGNSVKWHEPDIPTSSELIMSIPNVIIALALTEDGRKRMLRVNPFPELLSVLCSPRFSMPNTRCMLNDMASLIGSGLDEMIRHVPESKSVVIKAVVGAIKRISILGAEIVDKEENRSDSWNQDNSYSRISLVHFACNISHALEHVLQNDENCSDFVKEGGVRAILELYPQLALRGNELLSHISCQSSPSVANLSHSTAATNLLAALKRTAVNHNPSTVLEQIMESFKLQLSNLRAATIALREESEVPILLFDTKNKNEGSERLNASGILENIPMVTINCVMEDDKNGELLRKYSKYLLEIINAEWLSQVLSEVIRVCCHRFFVPDMRSFDANSRTDWQKILSSPVFKLVLEDLTVLYRTGISEVSRIRSNIDYERAERERCCGPGDSKCHPARYRLRIVCADGAVVRDGIDIDSCHNVGNLEMGEEIIAFERVVNRSGVMRYRTARGWVSEQTRGHGREPISEVVEVHGVATARGSKAKGYLKGPKVADYGISDLRSLGASILARLQNSQCNLYTSLSRLSMTCVKIRTATQQSLISPQIGAVVREIGEFNRGNFFFIQHDIAKALSALGKDGIGMFFGNVLSIFHSCIYEERRDKQYLNVPVLCNCLYHDRLYDSFLLSSTDESNNMQRERYVLPDIGFYAAIRVVMRYSIEKMKDMALCPKCDSKQRVNRAVASSLPSALALLRRLSSQNLLIDPLLTSFLQKMNKRDFCTFLFDSEEGNLIEIDGKIFSFRHSTFARSVHCQIGAITQELVENQDLIYCPPFILNSVVSLLRNVLICLEDSAKKNPVSDDVESFRNRVHRAISTALETNAGGESQSTTVNTDVSQSSAGSDNGHSIIDQNDIVVQKFEARLMVLSQDSLHSFKESLLPMALNLIENVLCPEGIIDGRFINHDLDDKEATTIVVCSFIIDFCKKYEDQQFNIVNDVFTKLLSMTCTNLKGRIQVDDGKADNFSSLCHAAVLLLRAMPKMRIHALQRNIASIVVQCLRGATSKIRLLKFKSFPPWITPALLLIEVMSHPMILLTDGNEKDLESKADDSRAMQKTSDYEKVCSCHRKRQNVVIQNAKRISFALSHSPKLSGKKDNIKPFSQLSSIPSFAPLISLETADHALSICSQLLRYRPHQKKHAEDVENSSHLPPEAAHAAVLLLTKILVIQKVASRFLRAGGVDLLLGLKSCSRFQGHISLITLALRLVVEDETTLQLEMEIEIRNTLTKLLKKQTDPGGVPMVTFAQAVKHLICRDPVSFLRGAATSISIQHDANGIEGSDSLVTLLPIDVRSKNSKILNDFFRLNTAADKRNEDGHKKPVTSVPKTSTETLMKQSSSKRTCDRGGERMHNHSHNASKRDRLEKFSSHGSSTSYVANHVLTEAIKSFQGQNENFEKKGVPFLFVFEYMDILCDLLLAIPSFANAICNVKVPPIASKKKGDNGTVLSYLLQTFLPQKRNFPNNRIQETTENSVAIVERKESYCRTKIAQSTARLLVALVARVGEGRRRVILELVIALNTYHDMNRNNAEDEFFMSALQSWGDLCLGLVAPRKLSTSLHDSSLSYEVLRVMSEHGMAHALLNTLTNIRLDHPFAATTAASLLKPLEIFTRPSVVDALQEMVPKSAKKSLTEEPRPSLKNGVGHTASTLFTEGIEEEAMLAEGFEADYSSSQLDIFAEDGLLEDEYDSVSSDEDSHDSEDDSDSQSTDSDEIDDENEMDASSDSESDSDRVSIEEETESVDEGEVIDDNEEEISESESENEDGTFQMEFDDDFHGHEDDQNDEYNEEDEEIEEDFVVDEVESDDEGWTNVESDGLGGIFGTRNAAHVIARPRQGNIMIETATSMLNNFLRSGEIEMEALADIEQGIGFQWPPSRRGGEQPRFRIRTMPLDRSDIGRTTLGERSTPNSATVNQDSMGPTPAVLQGSPPDIGFTSIAGLGRSNETNYMDYLFSGPIFGAGGAYYDAHLNAEDDLQSSNLMLTLPSTLDVELFPGGPAACTQTNSSTSTHPLISGVTLPPVNALLSINRSVDGHTSSRPRPANDLFREWWPELFSNVRGNVIRLHTSPIVNQNQSRASGDIATANGVILDRYATDFSRAFGNTLIEVVSHSEQGHHREEQSSSLEINNGTSQDRDEMCEQDISDEGHQESHHRMNNITERNENVTSSAEHDIDMDESSCAPLINQDGTNIEDIREGNSGNNAGQTNINDNTNTLLSIPTSQVSSISNTQHADNTTEGRSDSSETQVAENIADQSQNSTSSQLELEQVGVGNNVVCPPGVDHEVFSQLPLELQQEIIMQHEATASLALQLDASSNLDPDALAALPEDMRQEIIEQERNERRFREEQQDNPADPSRAEDLDPASFIASLTPDLREEILMTADNDFLNSLPPDILAEAQLLRERALVNRHRSDFVADNSQVDANRNAVTERNEQNLARQHASAKRKYKTKIRVDCNRTTVTFIPDQRMGHLGPLITPMSMKALLDLMFLLSPVRPQRLLQKVLLNICSNSHIRKATVISLVALLDDRSSRALDAINMIDEASPSTGTFFSTTLLGAAAVYSSDSFQQDYQVLRNTRSTSAVAIARNLPLSAKGSPNLKTVPPVVVRRIIGTLLFLTKNGNRLSVDILGNFGSPFGTGFGCLDTIIGLLAKSSISMSSSNLDDLLGVIESICAPLSLLPFDASESFDPSTKELEVAASSGKEFVSIPKVTVSPTMLKLLCSVLRFESCKDALFSKVNNITSRLSRVESNRKYLLNELASVAHELGNDAIRDLRSLRIRLDAAVEVSNSAASTVAPGVSKGGTPSSAVTLSTNAIELKLLRVLQLLHSLCFNLNGTNTKRSDEIPCASDELVSIYKKINLDALWDYLDGCLGTVSVLEGVTKLAEEQDKCSEYNYDEEIMDDEKGNKKLQNSVVGLLTRFLPTIEAFFAVNACVLQSCDIDKSKGNNVDCFVGGERLIKFISTNKVLLNALLRSNPTLLDKGFKAMVLIPRCNAFLDFDVKRFWFKQQVRKLRSQASRRHGSLRLTIRRDHVFEDAYRQLRLRTADEMRGRLHVTFVNEEGVDAGGLSREFFGILAKEIFNPNYALFTSTEDGCTFQPNPQSGINRDHLDYFRFVGRIVGKAVADGFLLDAHFTRSLYKHMLGLQPTYHDMQAIDPDYYKNLKMILDYQLEDIGLDLTFSTVTHWFGRSQVVDLIPNGRSISVTDQNKIEYVSLVCQHRMTTAIENQIKAYLDGFYDLVKRELIAIFTPKELELLISGLPDIDVSDLKLNTEYHGYRITDKEIVWFWNVMFSLSKSEKAAFLQFVTGSSKVPLNGFSDLQGMRGTQKFSIHKASLPAGSLMAAHTCFNSLDLPSYESEEEMKDKLLYAIKEGGGSFQFA